MGLYGFLLWCAYLAIRTSFEALGFRLFSLTFNFFVGAIRILRRIFGPTRDPNRERRRLHNEEPYSLYRSPNIVGVIKSRGLRWAGHVARMEEDRSAFKILTGKPTGKRPLGRPRWEENSKLDLQ